MKRTSQWFGIRYAGALWVIAPLLCSDGALAQTPQIVTNPVTHTIKKGGIVNFEVVATGELPLTYRWISNYPSAVVGPNTPACTNMTLNQHTCTLALTKPQASYWRVMVTNAQGSVCSPHFYIAVIEPGMETNGFRLSLTTTTNTTWRIECTTNLVDDAGWFTLTNISAMYMPKTVRFVDTAATNRNRLYRVVPTNY